MKIYRAILILILFVGFSGAISAQNKTLIERRVEQLKEALQLNDEQTFKITEIMSRLEQKNEQEQSAKPINKKAIMKERQKRLNEADKEIEALLTPAQLKKYESYKKERANKMKSRMQGRKFKD